MNNIEYEYYWLYDFVTNSNEKEINEDLARRTKLFNELGAVGWELMLRINIVEKVD